MAAATATTAHENGSRSESGKTRRGLSASTAPAPAPWVPGFPGTTGLVASLFSEELTSGDLARKRYTYALLHGPLVDDVGGGQVFESKSLRLGKA